MSSLRGYIDLVRPANVTTALADVLAGYALAGLRNPRALPWLLAATACLYAGGIVLNDYFDRDLDRVERPERPIPSGRVSAGSAAWLGSLLLTAGVLLAAQATGAAMIVATAIAFSVLLYDSWGKRFSLVAPLNMGLCRALNLLLGAAAVASRAEASVADRADPARLHRGRDRPEPGGGPRRAPPGRHRRSGILGCCSGRARNAGVSLGRTGHSGAGSGASRLASSAAVRCRVARVRAGSDPDGSQARGAVAGARERGDWYRLRGSCLRSSHSGNRTRCRLAGTPVPGDVEGLNF